MILVERTNHQLGTRTIDELLAIAEAEGDDAALKEAEETLVGAKLESG
jgi:hypothetical protein